MKRLAFSLLALGQLSACSGGTAEQKTAEPVAQVKVAIATLGEPAETVAVYGVASAGAATEWGLSAPVESIVVAIHAPPGTQVRAGEAIVTLRPSPSAALDYARAGNDAAQAVAAYERAKRLRADGLMSDADVESARALAASASSTRASLARRNGSLTLRAPLAGTVQMIGGSVGDLLAAGIPVAKIAKTGGASRARFGIDPALARRISAGATIRISPAASSIGYTVRVSSVDPVADPQTRLASIYAPIPPQANIASGETLSGLVTISRHAGAITIPYSALLDDGGQAYVFEVDGGVAHRKTVTTGAEEGGMIEITTGLVSGAQIVTSGGTALEDGMKVHTVK